MHELVHHIGRNANLIILKELSINWWKRGTEEELYSVNCHGRADVRSGKWLPKSTSSKLRSSSVGFFPLNFEASLMHSSFDDVFYSSCARSEFVCWKSSAEISVQIYTKLCRQLLEMLEIYCWSTNSRVFVVIRVKGLFSHISCNEVSCAINSKLVEEGASGRSESGSGRGRVFGSCKKHARIPPPYSTNLSSGEVNEDFKRNGIQLIVLVTNDLLHPFSQVQISIWKLQEYKVNKHLLL